MSREPISQTGRSRRRRTVAVVVGSLMFVIVVTLFSVELRRRRNLYWYDVASDYRYSFNQSSVTRIPVQLSATGFIFPHTDAIWDTAILRLRVTTGWSAWWFEPSVTVEVDGVLSRQFIERGGKGQRYLVLPAEALKPGHAVRLRGAMTEWAAQNGELLLFRNAIPEAPRTLVLAPHPDDAEIAAFGWYSAHDAYVVTITPGNYVDGAYAHLSADTSGQDALRARVRTWDSLMIPSWGGVSPDRTANLGYLGLSLEQLYRERHVELARSSADLRFGRYRRGALERLLPGRALSASPTWNSLVDDLTALLAAVRPDIVVAPHPVLDGSADHQLTTVALLEALEKARDDHTELFLYTNHHAFSEYYPFGPADAAVTLPAWFDAGLAFTSIYSFVLDAGQQRDKLFALDANHDLRPPPRRLLGSPGNRFVLRLTRSVADLIRDPVSDYSYFRRAVRPNELFFVYAPEDRAALLASGARRGYRLPGLR